MRVKVTATAVVASVAAMLVFTAQAETVRIVAIGASNTYAQAVSRSDAWPARLESLLQAKGYDVSVSVSGVTLGDAALILDRIDSAVPTGTKVVVYDTGGGRSRERGIDPAALRPQIEQRIRARGAKPVFAGYNAIVGSEQTNPSAWIAGDPNHHITVASHAKVAAALLPKVMAAIGRKN